MRQAATLSQYLRLLPGTFHAIPPLLEVVRSPSRNDTFSSTVLGSTKLAKYLLFVCTAFGGACKLFEIIQRFGYAARCRNRSRSGV